MMTVADMLAEFGIQIPDREPECYLIGLPGWRFHAGYDLATDRCCVLLFAWRNRINPPRWEYSYHFYGSVRFGRSQESVIDFGGPSWWPRFIKRWPSQANAIPSPRWTGHQYDIVGIDWPRLEFNFFKIPDSVNDINV